ncbi:MAG: hypothetical protein U0Q07_18170 [Acidimicrobiales bacterium]
MDEPAALQDDPSWRRAVWALRCGFAALVVVLVGVVVLRSSGTPWVLVVGVAGWLVAGGVTVQGVVRTHASLAEPRPSLWSLRFMVLRDTFRPRGAGSSS